MIRIRFQTNFRPKLIQLPKLNSRSCRGRLAQWWSVRFVKLFTRGPRFESRRGFFFSVANLFAKRIDGNLQLSDVLHQTSRNLDRKAVATSLLGKEECSLENWSYDVTAERVDNDVIYSAMQFYNYTSNLRQYQLTGLANGRVRALIVKGQDETKEGSSVHQYAGWAVGTGRRINRTVYRTYDTP